MRIAFLYNRSSEDPAHAAEDEFPERSPVVAALKRLGHEVTALACTLDLEKARRHLADISPDIVFNRVESLGGSDSMMAAMTLLLDSLQLPYTGNSTEALVATASKLSVKQRLAESDLPTPFWVDHTGTGQCGAGSIGATKFNRSSSYIIKPDLEHASFGIEDAAIVHIASQAELCEIIGNREFSSGRPYFAEEFIYGREFNISVMGDPPRVLPPAEIDFAAFPKGKPRIVSRDAKWDVDSFEYHNTPRQFEFPPSDRPLIDQLTQLTLECWRLFRLTGYARVDFRVDTLGQPWILEINTNPCISPEAGFAAALEQAGFSYDAGLQKLLDCAISRVPCSCRSSGVSMPLRHAYPATN